MGKPDKFKVSVRFQLYVESPSTGLSIAGPRLMKGALPSGSRPNIEFVSDDIAEANKQAKALEAYLNAYDDKQTKDKS